MRKKHIIILTAILLIAVFLFFHYQKEAKVRKRYKSQNIKFEDVFISIDSTIIKNNNLYSIINFTVNKNGNYIICDLAGKQVVMYDKNGNYLQKIMPTGKGPGEIIEPISICNDLHGNVYIADNGTRKISILDKDMNFVRSFLITGGHIPPFTMKISDNFLFMGGFRIHDKTFIHKYDLNGKYITSFFHLPEELKGTKFGHSLNLPYFDACDSDVFCTMSMKYEICRFDTVGSLKSCIELAPDYFVKFSEKNKKEFDKTFNTELLSNFSKPNFLVCFDNYIMIQIEMPRGPYEDGDYLKNAEYIIDIFTKNNFDIVLSGIRSSNLLMFADSANRIFYFLSKIDYSSSCFSILTCKIKDNIL